MSNIVLSDEDVKRLGGYRWDAKNQKKYLIQYAIIAAFGVFGVVAIEKYPSNWLPVILVAALMSPVSIFTPGRNNQTQKAVCRTVSQGCQELKMGCLLTSLVCPSNSSLGYSRPGNGMWRAGSWPSSPLPASLSSCGHR